MKTLYDSKTLRAVLNTGNTGSDAPPAMITFEGIGLTKRKTDGRFFGAPLVEKFGINVLHVMPRRPEWYHYADMDECLDALRPYLTPETFGYGSSMGAYAVARFADRLGIRRGICLSPQYSIQQSIVPFENRWQHHAARTEFLHDDSIAPRKARLWLFFDGADRREAEHARLIGESGPHEAISIPGAGHLVGRKLKRGSALSRIVEMFLAGRETRAGVDALVAGATEGLETTAADDKTARREMLRAFLHEMRAVGAGGRKAFLERVAGDGDLADADRFRLGLALMKRGDQKAADTILTPLLAAGDRTPFAARYHRARARLAESEGAGTTDRKGPAAVMRKQDPDARSRAARRRQA